MPTMPMDEASEAEGGGKEGVVSRPQAVHQTLATLMRAARFVVGNPAAQVLEGQEIRRMIILFR